MGSSTGPGVLDILGLGVLNRTWGPRHFYDSGSFTGPGVLNIFRTRGPQQDLGSSTVTGALVTGALVTGALATGALATGALATGALGPGDGDDDGGGGRIFPPPPAPVLSCTGIQYPVRLPPHTDIDLSLIHI